MSNVISIGCTCDYLVKRAARHRRAGRYDEAMALLWKAKNQFGIQEDIELEMARVYEEIGCSEEAERAYLRVMRMGGTYKALALFQLALSRAQRGDIKRAVSYYEQLAAVKLQTEVTPEMASMLGQQLREELGQPVSLSRRKYARILEHRAAERLQEGKASAAQLLMEHSLRLHPTARGYTMLACCHMIRMHLQEAVAAAQRAHQMAPSDVQTLCVLSDAYAAMDEKRQAAKVMHLAALRAKAPDDYLSVAMESAKLSDDRLTLRMTKLLLQKEPYNTHGMMLRACALVNLDRCTEASRIFGRLCGLLPEDVVCEYYFKLTREGKRPQERLGLGVDVTRQEGINRASELISMLYNDPEALCADKAHLQYACRMSSWAFHSPMAGSHTKTVALILLSAFGAIEAREVLLDLLTDPQMADHLKLNVLQVMTAKEGFQPFYVDMGGRLMRLAAGGVSTQPQRSVQANSRIVQKASDRISSDYPDSPQMMLDSFLAYLEVYGQPSSNHEDVCAAALEYLYHLKTGKPVQLSTVAKQYDVSERLLHMYVRRFERCVQVEADAQKS